jgi:aryl carrier-like protein
MFIFIKTERCSTTTLLDEEDEKTVDKFSDVVKYGYTSLCALALSHLFKEDKMHYEFSTNLITIIRMHLKLPVNSNEVFLALFQGDGDDGHPTVEVYVDLVKQEKNAFGFFILKDLIYFSVKSGN